MNFLFKSFAKTFHNYENLRPKLFAKHPYLQRNDEKNIFKLPQAFVVKGNKKWYLGDLKSIQYLEDSDVLDHLINSDLDQNKFRIYKDLPIFRFTKD